ncbi:MAG: glucose-methanol-choline oxidoreductase [Chloroflexi bacterium RBG_13_50_21]|nr:MAG: glucose-methanol-choline oxidoreductase [Chloroflexi bacterium RBG_13_50_21]OGO66780.1 MAG: glucose-methanol-choline oxidoreductase [Chloroflexi bacterium RBG_19FT_COMBO_47_9]
METWKQLTFDTVVIGSGPGGATVAAELSRQGKKVLILEWGSGAAVKGTMLQTIGMALIPGRGLFFTPELLSLVRVVSLGGSSIGAYATAFEPNYEIFEKHGIDLKPQVEQAKRELPIAPLGDDLVGPSAQRAMSSARDLGYPWEKLPKMVHQDKCRSDCDKCTMGCPYGAKWTSRELIEQACGNGSILLTGARVTSLIIEGNRIAGVQFRMGGSLHNVSAPLVILAAGGIGTPLLLRQSGITNAGSDFFFDPLVVVAGTLDGLNDGREFPMATGFHDPEEGYVLTDLIWPGWIRVIFTLRAGRVDRLSGHCKMISIMVKIKDDLGGNLTRRGWANKKLTASDQSRLRRGSEVARKILLNAGARNIYHTGIAAVHPGGTAKIGDVVDANLKTRFDNLYVCDCSVIPDSWGLPPTLTIVALGKRLARHLA